MKHTFQITLALVSFFFLAQFIGLLIINQYIDHKVIAETHEVAYKPLPYNLERPEVENQSTSFIYITIAIIAGTLIVLILVKFNKIFIWKFWFFATIWLTLSIAFAAFMDSLIAAMLAFVLSILKLYKPNIIIQNTSEIFVYGGLAAVFVPIINLFAAFMLLIVISVYDYISVYKTKHMIKLADFQTKSKVFAGLMIPYERNKASKSIAMPRSEIKKEIAKSKHSVAVLGGGDIGFTLIFAGVVMKDLMLRETILIGFLKTMIVPIVVSISLLLLLLKGKQNKFYPAMPILSLGCLIGYLIVFLI